LFGFKVLEEASLARTMTHLLRFSKVRLEKEGQVLFDDIHALRELLPDVQAYLSSQSGAAEEIAAIAGALKSSLRDPRRYASLSMLAEEAGSLRAALYGALKRLINLKPALGSHADYQEIRRRIRSYIGDQRGSEAGRRGVLRQGLARP
jgi:hypothetical protein